MNNRTPVSAFTLMLLGFLGSFGLTFQVEAAAWQTCVHPSGTEIYTKQRKAWGPGYKCTPGDTRKGMALADTPLDPAPSKPRPANCPSRATLIVKSSDYFGSFTAELRLGKRPGSRRLDGRTLSNGQQVVFTNLCPGTYFFAFGPTGTDEVSVTRYFPVVFSGERYSNPTITVHFNRAADDEIQAVQRSRKKDL